MVEAVIPQKEANATSQRSAPMSPCLELCIYQQTSLNPWLTNQNSTPSYSSAANTRMRAVSPLPAAAHREKMQHCVEKCHLTPGKSACFCDAQNFKNVNEGKSKSFLSQQKRQFIFSSDVCSDNYEHLCKTFLQSRKASICCLYRSFPFLITDYVQSETFTTREIVYVPTGMSIKGQ